MTTTIVLANANDGYLTSGSPFTFNDAQNGNALGANNGYTFSRYGSEPAFGVWWAYESFLQFDYTRPANEIEVGVDVGIIHVGHYGTQSRQMQMYFLGTGTGLAAWGPPVGTEDWVNPLGVFFTARGVRVHDVQASGTSQYVWAGSDLLTQRVRTYGTLSYQFMVCTDRQLDYNSYPAAAEFSEFWTAESSLDPAMVVTSVPVTTLYNTLGAQAQLSDGSHVVIESNGATPPALLLRHVNKLTGAATTIWNLSGFAVSGYGITNGAGSQQVALAVDDADNVYVVGKWATVANSIGVQAFAKGIGYTWSAKNPLAEALPYSEADPNNYAVAWHGAGGGTLVAMVARGSSDGWHVASSEICYVLMNTNAPLAGGGTMIRTSGVAVGAMTPTISNSPWTLPANDTGSNLDVTALSPTVGVMHTMTRYDRLGARQPTCKTRYTLDPTGYNLIAPTHDLTVGLAGATWGVKTATSKVRVLPISSDTCAVITADSVAGISIGILRTTGVGSPFTTLGWVLLGNEGLATMPAAATLAESQAWDAIYLRGPNKIWIYYFDVANGRRLMRTAVSLNTLVATREEIQVNAAVGSAGSTNPAIRMDRSAVTLRWALVTVANRSSGGALSTVYVVDTPNEAPSAPLLRFQPNFDATVPVTFAWVPVDVDYSDVWTGYQLDINTAAGVDVYDSGMVISSAFSKTLAGGTLTNGQTYQWRVRTRDEAGLVGPYSAYQTFTTAAGGTVVITDPVADNPANIITSTYPVSWTLTGAVQNAYRVVVKVNSTSAEVYNSGWVSGTATTHAISGMASDVEHRIEVTTRTSLLVESNTGTRLITPSYATPDAPVLTVAPLPADGHTLLSVSNPAPSGDRPDVVRNELRRRVEATSANPAGAWVNIGAITVGGIWKDFTAASGVGYEYQAVAVAADSSYQLSSRMDGRLCLQGIWIHDPIDPAHAEGTAQHYRFGWQGKSDNTAVEAEGTHYAGRELPVFDFGTQADETLKIPIQVPRIGSEAWWQESETLKALARSRRTLCYRDARGRRVFGVVSEVDRTDENYGESVEFTVTSVDYTEQYTGFGPPVVVAGDGPDSDDDMSAFGWDGGDVLGGMEDTLDGGDVCGGDPCAEDELVDAGSA